MSDIHASSPLEPVLAYFESHHFDLLVLLGDILNYGPRNGLCHGLDPQAVVDRLNAYADRIVAVRGNCDSEVDQMLLNFPIQSTYTYVVDNGCASSSPTAMFTTTRNSPSVRRATYLSSATPTCSNSFLPMPKIARPIILNTGSPTFPKGGNPPTFATYAQGMLAIRTLDEAALQSLKVDAPRVG